MTAVVTCIVLAGCGRTAAKHDAAGVPISGTINGQPLAVAPPQRAQAAAKFRLKHLRAPDGAADEQEVAALMQQSQCERIQGAIQRAAVADQKQRFGISVTASEAEALQKEYWRLHDPQAEAAKTKGDYTALVEALTQVYEKGADPQQAYNQYLAPRGYAQSAWQMNLEAGRTAEGRAALGRLAGITAGALQQADPKAYGGILEKQRLDAAVDNDLASQDPTFRKYLDVLRQAERVIPPFQTGSAPVPMEALKYASTKRNAWWQARYAEVKVVLTDPQLAARCAITSGNQLKLEYCNE